jgi:cytidylate kinase
VLPDAELKVFLTASVRIRAERRYEELQGDQKVPIEQLEREIAARDRSDEERKHSPLIRARDAVLIDSSDLTIEQVVQRIVDFSRTKLAEAK